MTHRDFLSVVGDLALLSQEVASGLVQEAANRGIPPSQLAMQLGLLDAVQVDIVETLLHPGEIVPGYEILGVIGHGGMGVVYRARQKALDRVVALKTVLVGQLADATSVFRFEQEARSVARLQHPNVVAAFEFGRQAGRMYFAMELVNGEDLEEFIRQRGRLDEATAWGIARQAAAGLAHAHQQGIIHRDIKPANLLLVTPPQGFATPAGLPMVKIADFGLAFLQSEDESRTRLTAANRTVGSPHYVAPELLSGGPVDLRADIYSLGATVFHMLAGYPPFAGKSLTQIITEKVSQESPALAEHASYVSPASAQLVADMMARDPQRRIGSYDELLRRMSVSPTGMDAASTWTLPSDGIVTRRRRALWAWLSLALLLLVGAVTTWQFYDRGAAAPVPPRDLVSAGETYLFDGLSLEGWAPRGGTWTTFEHEEDGNLISGTDGVYRRAFPATAPPRVLQNYRIGALFRLHEADTVGFHFGIVPSPDNNGPRYVLRVSAEGAVLGEQPNDIGPFQALGPTLPLPQGPRHLYGIQIERQHDTWWAFLKGKELLLVGAVPARPGPSSPELRLSASGEAGPAYFGDIRLGELVPPRSK